MPLKHKPNADDVRRVALAALATALEDRKEEVKKKPCLTGVRAVATGAVFYTAGRAFSTVRRFVRDHFGSDGEAREDEPQEEEDEEPEDEVDEEPEAEEQDDAEDEEYEEPEAEEDEEEPEAEEDEEPEDEE